MWRALLLKEFRECGLYAAIALILEMYHVGVSMDLHMMPGNYQSQQQSIPFMSADFQTFTNVAIIAGIVFGLHQTVWESWRQTTLFLLHRPIPRRQIMLAKIAAGCLLLLGITAPPLLIYILWAATPGTHASPFFPELTEAYWRGIVVAVVCYLGAFLTGIRPARLIGSRTWPLITAILLSAGLHTIPNFIPLVYLGLLALSMALTYSILTTAELREFP